jgi:hypothetical protein
VPIRIPIPRPAARRAAAALVALVAALALAVAASAAPARSAQAPAVAPLGTPVLGSSMLGAEQIAAWYAATGVASRSPTDVALLARLFVDEGAAQGVRGDIAFAQAMLETGYLRYGGLVRPGDHNFSGLGACDSCARGLAFTSPELGVRAQIQHLWAYAAPGATPLGLARPLADVRFSMVQPPGRAPLWEMMGNGNWATGADYAAKVLRIWRGMLAWNGVPEPPPSAAPGVGLQGPLMVRTAASGAGNLAGWPLRREPLAGGIVRLGPASSVTRVPRGCLARWPALGAAILVSGPGDPCAAETAAVRWARLSGEIWRTQRGLEVGASLARLRELYPRARPRQGRWWLIAGRAAGSRQPAPRLRAEVRTGRVRALWVDVG